MSDWTLPVVILLGIAALRFIQVRMEWRLKRLESEG